MKYTFTMNVKYQGRRFQQGEAYTLSETESRDLAEYCKLVEEDTPQIAQEQPSEISEAATPQEEIENGEKKDELPAAEDLGNGQSSETNGQMGEPNETIPEVPRKDEPSMEEIKQNLEDQSKG